MSKESDLSEISIPIQPLTSFEEEKEEEKEEYKSNCDTKQQNFKKTVTFKRKSFNSDDNSSVDNNNNNIYRSTCCRSKTNVDIRLLGFFAQCSVSFAVLGFSMRQIMSAQRGDDLTIYYTLIGSIVGNFVPSYYSNRKQS